MLLRKLFGHIWLNVLPSSRLRALLTSKLPHYYASLGIYADYRRDDSLASMKVVNVAALWLRLFSKAYLCTRLDYIDVTENGNIDDAHVCATCLCAASGVR